jgi:hypothetical protein
VVRSLYAADAPTVAGQFSGGLDKVRMRYVPAYSTPGADF